MADVWGGGGEAGLGLAESSLPPPPQPDLGALHSAAPGSTSWHSGAAQAQGCRDVGAPPSPWLRPPCPELWHVEHSTSLPAPPLAPSRSLVLGRVRGRGAASSGPCRCCPASRPSGCRVGTCATSTRAHVRLRVSTQVLRGLDFNTRLCVPASLFLGILPRMSVCPCTCPVCVAPRMPCRSAGGSTRGSTHEHTQEHTHEHTGAHVCQHVLMLEVGAHQARAPGAVPPSEPSGPAVPHAGAAGQRRGSV